MSGVVGVSAAAVPGQIGGDERELADAVRQRVVARLAAYAGEREAAGLPPEDETTRRATVQRLLGEELGTQWQRTVTEGGPALDPWAEQRIAQAVEDALFGTGRLERLLADESLENICVNGCDVVWVKDAHGQWHRRPPVAASDAELVELVRTLAAGVDGEERRFDHGMPRLNLQLRMVQGCSP